MIWYQERMHKHKHSANPKFFLCCGNGKVKISFLKHPLQPLSHLMFDRNAVGSKNFQSQIKAYNMMFAFTSPRAKLDNKFNIGRGSPTIRIQGQACHRIGSLLPSEGHPPKFAQLYIYDSENEVTYRMDGLM